MACLALLLVALLGWMGGAQASQGESFTEELLVRPLQSGHLLLHFHFAQAAAAQRHHTTFPKAISQLVGAVDFRELELSFTHGRWHYHKWGQPPLQAKPVGAEMRAAFSPQLAPDALEQRWGNLSHALSGLTCASLNFLARQETTARQATHMSVTGPQPARLAWLYSALPKEPVCTENLTPWLRLLPCRDQDGLAALLASRGTIYGASYHSMGLQLRVARDQAGRPASLHLTQTLTLVVRPAGAGGGGGAGPGRARGGYPDWQLAATLGAQLPGSCPLASASRLLVQLPGPGAAAEPRLTRLPAAEDGGAGPAGGEQGAGNTPTAAAEGWTTEAFELSAAPDALLLAEPPSAGGGQGRGRPPLAAYMYDLRRPGRGGAQLSALAQAWAPAWVQAQQQQLAGRAPGQPRWAVHRYTTGIGNMHGSMVLQLLAAPSPAGEGGTAAGSGGGQQPVCIFQVVPWYVRMWLHTLALTIDGQPAGLDAHLLMRHISLPQDRARPLLLDLCLALPANATTASLSADYSKAFLHVFEYPPDAHRGFDVPAAIVSFPPAAAGDGLGGLPAEQGMAWSVQWLAGGNGDEGGNISSVEASPLLQLLGERTATQVYSEGLLVPLATPDFSMPYNVICLTSTVLAMYTGAMLNTLLRRTDKRGADAEGVATKARAERRRKVAKVALVLLVFGGLGVYLDDGLQDMVKEALGMQQALAPGAV